MLLNCYINFLRHLECLKKYACMSDLVAFKKQDFVCFAKSKTSTQILFRCRLNKNIIDLHYFCISMPKEVTLS